MRIRFILMAVLAMVPAMTLAAPARAEPAPVEIRAGDAVLRGLLYKPEGTGPFPAVIVAHGCGGLAGTSGPIQSRYRDWAELLVKAGFAALFPDSYGSRALDAQCRVADRRVRASRERLRDLDAARDWLARQSFVAKDRISLLGFANGGTASLWAVRLLARAPRRDPDFRSAIVLYPNCDGFARSAWSARVPTLVLIGAQDDWNAPQNCERMIEGAKGRSALTQIMVYPAAHHDFDRANLPLQERTGLAALPSGSNRAHVGTDPVARDDARRRVAEWLGR